MGLNCKIGDIVHVVDVRNSDLQCDNLLGLSMTKEFRPSTSNIVGTDLSKYKIVGFNEFAVDFMSAIRVHKMPIALNRTGSDIIVSPAYGVFAVNDEDVVLPEYLMLWFMRPDFDRYADFKSDSAIRGGYDWYELCDTEINLPPISEQRKIVHDYQVITDRIELLRKMNENLEEQVLALYHQMFDVDGVCHDGTVSDLGDVVGGATPSTENPEYFCSDGIVWLSPKDLTGTGLKFIFKGETDITEEGYKSCSTKMLPKGSVLLTSRAPVGTVAIAMKEMCTNQGFKSIVPKADYWTAYIYCLLKDNKQLLEANASGTTFLEISGYTLKKLVFPIPDEETVKKFDDCCKPFFEQQMLFEKEYTQLSMLASVRVSSIAKGA